LKRLILVGFGKYARLGKFKASRIAWELTYGTIPEGLYVCHHCDNRICVRPDHLFLGTQAENIHDMQSKRRGNYGERNGIAKLTEPDVIAIKFAQGLTNAEMSRHYHVSQSVISEIRKGTAWKYLNQKVGV
jgi:hypothetical protein